MITVRIKFKKVDLAAFFSHLDLQRSMQRALKKSGLPVWYSMGYNPHIYMTFPLPLSLGQESECECVDFRLTEERSEEQIISALKGTLPMGIIITGVCEPTFDAKDIGFAQYNITLYGDDRLLNRCVDDYNSSQYINVEKSGKKKTEILDIKQYIKNFTLLEKGEGYITIDATFSAGLDKNINPSLLVEYFASKYGIDRKTADIVRKHILDRNMNILQ